MSHALYPVAPRWHSQIADTMGDLKDLAILSVEQAAALLAQDPARAEEWARAALKQQPDDPRVLLILGSAHRRLGDPEAAYRVLAPLAQSHPRAAHTHYELGATLVALGHTAEAIAVLRRTTMLNPDLPEAWRALGEQLFREGEASAAEEAFAQQFRASVRNPALRTAAKALSLGHLTEAENELRAYLTAHPNDREASHLMGAALIRLGRSAAAEVALRHCLELDANQDGARFAYADALLHQQKGAEALLQAQHLLQRKPDDPAYLNLLAASLGLIGDDQRALEIYKRLSEEYPKQPRIWLNYGHALRTVGKSHEAVAAYRRCIALAPNLGDAYWSLANLKVATFTPDEEATMLAQIARPDLGADDRLHLHYALGKALEDRGDLRVLVRSLPAGRSHAARFDSVRRRRHHGVGAEIEGRFHRPVLCRSRQRRRPVSCTHLHRGIAAVRLDADRADSCQSFPGRRHAGTPGYRLHRARPRMDDAAGDEYPARVTTLDDGRLAALGHLFLDRTRVHRKLDRPFFIDKMPNNFLHIGLIRLILPNAKIIDARRHPLGACFSTFKQHFAQGQPFSYDLGDLGRYYRDYVDLMGHFGAALPGRIHRVVYEDLVEDTETIVRGLLDYCGLPFEDTCLKFYENDRSVRTVSSEQVRRPIFRDGISQWRHYEPWLAPLKEALGPALEHWRT